MMGPMGPAPPTGGYIPEQAYPGAPEQAYAGDRAPADSPYRGQSYPDDDERLPVRAAGTPPSVQASVESNDPAVPIERPSALRTLPANRVSAPEETAAEGAPGPSDADSGYATAPVNPDAVNPALVRPSRQELA